MNSRAQAISRVIRLEQLDLNRRLMDLALSSRLINEQELAYERWVADMDAKRAEPLQKEAAHFLACQHRQEATELIKHRSVVEGKIIDTKRRVRVLQALGEAARAEEARLAERRALLDLLDRFVARQISQAGGI
jgi:hypothetical protein